MHANLEKKFSGFLGNIFNNTEFLVSLVENVSICENLGFRKLSQR